MVKVQVNDLFQKSLNRIQYFLEYIKEFNRYKYILEGEVHSKNSQQTMLLYRVRGKRDIFELSAQDICNNPALISKFHPLDVRIISYISGVEQIINVAPTERTDQFHFIKNKIFNKR